MIKLKEETRYDRKDLDYEIIPSDNELHPWKNVVNDFLLRPNPSWFVIIYEDSNSQTGIEPDHVHIDCCNFNDDDVTKTTAVENILGHWYRKITLTPQPVQRITL